MNDVMLGLDTLCTIFLKVATGAALLTFSRACLAYAKRGTMTATVTATTTTTSSTPVLAERAVDLDRPMDSAEEVLKAPEPPVSASVTPQEEVIECGNCHNDIRSEPIQQILTPPSEIYKCEHCGSQVQVQL